MSPSPHLGAPQNGRVAMLDRPATRPRRLARAGVVALTCSAVFAAAAPAQAGPIRARSAGTGSSAASTAAGSKGALTAPQVATTATAQAAAAAVPPIYFGAVGDVSTLKAKTGSQQIGVHVYGNFAGSVPTGRMITVGANGRWADVAAAKSGSAMYSNIVRWAQTIKGRQGRILLAYQHEPEISSKTSLGTAQDFINAFRRVVTIFREQGVQNVTYTWQMTDWAFRTSSSDRQYAAKWYPGDAYVDTVGADAYNWNVCGEGQGRWVQLSTLFGPVISFAKAHGKKASLPEYGSYIGSQRAQWLANAHAYLVTNKASVQAVFYFQHAATNPANSDCKWPLSTSAEYLQYGQMARDTANFTP